jgi:hypothetical protein
MGTAGGRAWTAIIDHRERAVERLKSVMGAEAYELGAREGAGWNEEAAALRVRELLGRAARS